MDQLDKEILGYIMRDGPLTVAELLARIYEGPDDRYQRHKLNSTIRYRVSKMVAEDLLWLSEYKYQLSKCSIHDSSTTSFDDGSAIDTGPAICFHHEDGSVNIIFLGQV